MCQINEIKELQVNFQDESAASSQTRRMKAEVDKNEHVGAPMKGEVVVVKVQPGDVVEAGQVRIEMHCWD